MKELTMDEKMGLLVEVNEHLSTIPGCNLNMPKTEVEHSGIILTDKGYIYRILAYILRPYVGTEAVPLGICILPDVEVGPGITDTDALISKAVLAGRIFIEIDSDEAVSDPSNGLECFRKAL